MPSSVLMCMLIQCMFKASSSLSLVVEVITFNIMAGACAAVHQWQQAITFLQDSCKPVWASDFMLHNSFVRSKVMQDDLACIAMKFKQKTGIEGHPVTPRTRQRFVKGPLPWPGTSVQFRANKSCLPSFLPSFLPSSLSRFFFSRKLSIS